MGAATAESIMNVVHSVNMWLPQTMTWLHTQIQSLPAGIVSSVVSAKVTNLDQFPVENLVSAEHDNSFWRALGRHSSRVTDWRCRLLLQRQIVKSEAAVLHSHFGDRGWANLEIARANSLRHVVTFYGYDASRLPIVEPIWRDRFLELFAEADLFLCEGPHLCRVLVELGCPVDKTRVHHLGVQVSHIPYAERRRDAGSRLKVLIAGTFVQKKGIPAAIRALDRIRHDVDLEITLIGDAGNQPRMQEEKKRILQAIENSDLGDRIRLLGYQPYDEFLRQAYAHDIFLSPSQVADDGDSEGGAPVSLIEMAATGIPIVSTRHCDIPNVVIHGETGLLAEEGDVDQLAEHLAWLAANPEAAMALAARSRERVEREFDSGEQGLRLGRHYIELSGSTPLVIE